MAETLQESDLGNAHLDDRGLYAEWAYCGCSGLRTVTVSKSVMKIGFKDFFCCSGLTSITIPNSVTLIDDYAFAGCTGLTTVIIPESVTEIGCRAFAGCKGLTSVTVPDSATTIGEGAFDGCNGLISVFIYIQGSAVEIQVKPDSDEYKELTQFIIDAAKRHGMEFQQKEDVERKLAEIGEAPKVESVYSNYGLESWIIRVTDEEFEEYVKTDKIFEIPDFDQRVIKRQ